LNGFNFGQGLASSLLNLSKSKNNIISNEYLIGTNSNNIINNNKGFIISQNHHIINNIDNISLSFPSNTYVEKKALYYNIENRVQNTSIALNSSGFSCSDWIITYSLIYNFIIK